jgi:hypothetical protein
VRRVLAVSNEKVRNSRIDLRDTYTNKFVKTGERAAVKRLLQSAGTETTNGAPRHPRVCCTRNGICTPVRMGG